MITIRMYHSLIQTSFKSRQIFPALVVSTSSQKITTTISRNINSTPRFYVAHCNLNNNGVNNNIKIYRNYFNYNRKWNNRSFFSSSKNVLLSSSSSSTVISLPWDNSNSNSKDDRPSWSNEWKQLGLGAKLINQPLFPKKLFFIQIGFGIDQHGESGIKSRTKASIRAVRNAIEFNSIPGVIEHIPGGRQEMLIHVKLGIPSTLSNDDDDDDDNNNNNNNNNDIIDVLEVAKVFPYGKLLPIQVVIGGGLDFPTGRIVNELGDTDDIGICVVACVTIGYDDDNNNNNDDDDDDDDNNNNATTNTKYKTFSTKDGY